VAIAKGETAPAFVLPDEKGKPVNVPGEASVTVLVFYRGDW
jgi:peroxiredoxin